MVAAMHVRALEVWAGWATGAPVTDRQLRVTRQALTHMPGTDETRHLIAQLDTDPALANPYPNQAHSADHGTGGLSWNHDHDQDLDRSDGMDLGR